MATRNLVPRATDEGSIGTDAKQWNELNVNKAYASNNVLVFNTVADMKASNKVKAGYTLKTLGYYSLNDGGGAEYVVVDDIGDDEPDDGSIIQLQKNLYAKLMISDYVNVKQFGAVSDSVTDDTVAIQAAIDYATKNPINENGLLNIKPVIFPTGNYKLTSTITLYSVNRLISVGQVSLDFYLNNIDDVAIQINGYRLSPLTEQWWGRGYQDGCILDGSNGGFTIRNLEGTFKGDVTTQIWKGIAISLGDLTNTGNEVAYSILKGVVINFFSNGIRFNPYNQYLINIQSCRFEWCNSCFYLDNSNADTANSGENTRINDCVFANSTYAVRGDIIGMLHFYGCSFDFLATTFYYPTASDSFGEIILLGCYLERPFLYSTGYILQSNTNMRVRMAIIGTRIVQYNIDDTNGYFNASNAHIKIIASLFVQDNMENPHTFLTENAHLSVFETLPSHYGTAYLTSLSKNLIPKKGNFSYKTSLDETNLTTSGLTIDTWKLTTNVSAVLSLVDVNDFYNITKALRITYTNSLSQPQTFIETPYIPVEANTLYQINYATRSNVTNAWRHVKVFFYDKDLQEIEDDTLTAEVNNNAYIYPTSIPNAYTNKVCFPNYAADRYTPAQTMYMKIRFGLRMSQAENGYYTDFILGYVERN